MAYTLEQLTEDIRAELSADGSAAGQRNLLPFVSKALLDDDFVAKHLTADDCKPRKVLYEDPDLGFCICGHVYEAGMDRVWPHDHGSAWAIYGLAGGDTEMTDWNIVKAGEGKDPTLVEPVKKYDLQRGDCYLYEVGAVHSPIIGKGAKLVRIEGANLDRVKRSHIRAA